MTPTHGTFIKKNDGSKDMPEETHAQKMAGLLTALHERAAQDDLAIKPEHISLKPGHPPHILIAGIVPEEQAGKLFIRAIAHCVRNQWPLNVHSVEDPEGVHLHLGFEGVEGEPISHQHQPPSPQRQRLPRRNGRR